MKNEEYEKLAAIKALLHKTTGKLGKWFKPLIWALCCLIAFLLLGAFSRFIQTRSPFDLTLKVWNSDEKSAVVSYYFQPQASLTITALENLIYRAADSLGSAGALKESSHENAKVLAGAYAAFFETKIAAGQHALQPVEATAIAAGGDFFMIHPFKLISGAYPALTHPENMQVLLDETLAWQVFGSTDIIGMPVLISDHVYTVSGVFQKDTSKLNRMAKMPAKLFIMPFAAGGNPSVNADGANPVPAEVIPAMFEVLAQNPVKGFAQTTLKPIVTSAIAPEDKLYVKEYPLRFSFAQSIKDIVSLPDLAMNHTPYTLPYWENAQRGLEFFTMLSAFLQSLALLYIAIFTLTALFRGILYLRFNTKKVFKGIASLFGICYNRIRLKLRSVKQKEIKGE